MNKTILIFAIFAFCFAPIALSSESQDRELAGIKLGNLGDLINKALNSTKNAATNTTTTTPSTPVVSTPVVSTPVVSTPVVSTPVVSTPVVSTPVESTPVVSTPVVSTPVVSTPVESTPVVSTPVTTPTTPAAPTINYYKNDVTMSAFKDDCIRVHNEQRLEVGLGNLTWSDSLAASAQAWANDMATNGFRHSGKSGENIASTTYTTSVLGRLLGLWVHEKYHYIVGCKYPSCSTTSAEVGHYTQMVWHSTTQVGCGFAPGANRNSNYLCCQYYKAGNIVGQSVY